MNETQLHAGITINLNDSLEFWKLPKAAMRLGFGSSEALRKRIEHNETYRKYFWRVGTDYETSPLMLALLQFELAKIDHDVLRGIEAMQPQKKAA